MVRIYQKFIKYETAKLAKQKGFTLANVGSHIFNYFNDDGTEGDISWGHLCLENAAKVPHSILQDWLREAHGIDLWFGVQKKVTVQC